MKKERKLLKLFVSLGVKGALCIICLAAVGVALVTYQSSVLINPWQQLTIGATSASWSVYVNDVNQVRYMPGGFSEPTLNPSNTNTYAFKVDTDQNKVCAVEVQLYTAMNSSEFYNFNITVLSSAAGGSWAQEPLYAAATGSTTIPYINGLTTGAAGYIHQNVSLIKYYLIQVTYSYDLVNATTPILVTFVFTPLPQDTF